MERLPRIAFFSEHASPVALLGSQDAGGQNVYVDEVSRNLGRLGYAVDVFVRRDSADAPEVIDWAHNVRVVNLTAGPAESLLKDELWPLMPAFHDAFMDFMMRDGTRYSLSHGNFWMSGWVAAKLRRRLHLPAVQIFHAMGKTKQRHQGAADTSPQGRIAVEMDIVQQVDRLIAQCPSEYQELTHDYDADPHKVIVIPSAVNVDRYRPVPKAEARAKLGIPQDEFVVVYVGRMMPRKDVRNVVRGLAAFVRKLEAKGVQLDAETLAREVGSGSASTPQMPRVRLLLVGGETADANPAATPEIGELQRLASELGVAHLVQFFGKRQPDELRYYYSAGDVAVTTPWYEPFGLTPLEGMACGRPVIGSAVGGITFTIADKQTGFLVPPKKPEALAEKLLLLYEQPALSHDMGEAARSRVEREFTWATVARRTAALYEALLADAERPTDLTSFVRSRRGGIRSASER